ncbi:MAG TPA: tautomerase family protein [Rhabdaerophilum sp.]|nr:tautomerase family protein [Rhabdaerophilum sp.]
MPFVRIDLAPSVPETLARPIADAAHNALIEAVGIPPDDRFQIVASRQTGMIYDRSFLGVDRSETMVMVEVHLSPGRTVAIKQAFYATLAEKIVALGLRADDLFIHLVETTRENWSFGKGIAQYVLNPPTHIPAQ